MAAANRIEFEGRPANQLDLVPGNWWRRPLTGRADGDYVVIVKRDGQTIASDVVAIRCDGERPVITEAELQVITDRPVGYRHAKWDLQRRGDIERTDRCSNGCHRRMQ